jgi:hypothetical protein
VLPFASLVQRANWECSPGETANARRPLRVGATSLPKITPLLQSEEAAQEALRTSQAIVLPGVRFLPPVHGGTSERSGRSGHHKGLQTKSKKERRSGRGCNVEKLVSAARKYTDRKIVLMAPCGPSLKESPRRNTVDGWQHSRLVVQNHFRYSNCCQNAHQ